MGNSLSVESPSLLKRKYLDNLEEKLEALQKEMQDLNAIRNDHSKRLSENTQGLQEVKEWVSMVQEIEPRANRLLDESVSEMQRLSRYDYGSLLPASTFRYSEKVLMTLEQVKTLRTKGFFEDVVSRRPLPPLVIKMPPIQLALSQQNLFERACQFLEEQNVGALCIYGRAGVGKTTLLTKIKNKFLLEAFGLVIFVVVKSEVVESIQDAIIGRLGLLWGTETKEDKAAKIYMALKGQRFLLLLDGIQRGLDLDEIGVPFPSQENGCKIVLTTRSREACDESKWVDAKVEVTCLSPEESWDLFQETVGEKTLRSHQDIPKLARVVASSCRGLPLALSVIGVAMSRKRTVREWRYSIHVLASSTAEFPDMEDGALPVLKSIYDNMSDENIRLCFLYCALFPETCDIRKEDLINYWICEGILANEDRGKAEIQGYEIICDLVRMRLLMEVGNGYCVKMHGLVREMALWIASDFGRQIEHFVVVAGERIHQMPMVNDWGMVRRMSVTSTQIQNISDSLQCSELTTLVFQRNRHLKLISGTFFQRMTSLVVLDLSFNKELGELPEEVSSLVLLRYLNLSWTCIKGLPLGLKELKSLIHLDLDYTSNLQEIDVIASLLNLQVLRLFHSVSMDLKLMEDIQLLKSLKELSLTVRGSSALQKLLRIHGLASSIQRLHLTETTISDGGSLSLNAMFGLRELDILGCNIPEITTDWSSTIQRDIERIPQLQNIRTLTIHGCECVRDLTWLLLAPCLGDLSVSECPQMEEVISKEKAMTKLGHTSEQPFQNLTKLVLDGLPKLESIYWTPLPFPVLEYLEIRRCPELRRHPFNSESAVGNQVEMKIDEKWIKVVELEDEATKQRFSHISNSKRTEYIDFPQMAEDPTMDGLTLTSESHPIQNIDQVGTTGSGKTVVQSGTHATAVENPRRSNLFSTVKGFLFSGGDKKGVSLTSNSSDREVNQSGSVFNSRDVSGTSAESSMGRKNSYPTVSTRASNLRQFSITDLKSATKNFSQSVMIGEGGFGCVFRGTVTSLEDPSIKIEVAVKQLGKIGVQGRKEWVTEVNFIGIVEHINLVKLIGYCAEDDDERGIQRLLVFEYMPNRSVEFHLSPRSHTVLTWALRVRIAQDAARGLAYLHEEMDFQITFCEFKSSNILLDEDWIAKLLKFGLASLGSSEGLTHVSTSVVGTMDYAAPEYIQTGRLTSKSDVWAYGVFLYELITGRRPIDRSKPKGEQKLLEWVRPYLSDTRKFKLILDPRLEGKYPIKSVQKLAVVANRCLVRNPKARPKMSEVLEMVTKIVEASTGNGSPQLDPLNTLKASRDGAGGQKQTQGKAETSRMGKTLSI
ncbi:PREDICTED: probable disease resistance protein At5g47260 isoform X2 [Camelina sativa]|uniref:Probable disease resistance protein At5g47260 isoform X2 n=1 Tax=Camelina sativa TaxID=90675 RepID=A0ABM0Y3Q6_CAMSA|nr:PREDICTED: probable disease resistance protein At5g47260 isoform X2 [Camelina sativa]